MTVSPCCATGWAAGVSANPVSVPCTGTCPLLEECVLAGLEWHCILPLSLLKTPSMGPSALRKKDLAPGYGIRLHQAHSLKKSPLVSQNSGIHCPGHRGQLGRLPSHSTDTCHPMVW